ncbi:hypothetical protein BDW22DRAFT_1353682 [Trametopsis cervina]|nr:hypothetical protein BDW22DRAFT_1353682 [Trametopsis cervina]
MDGIDELAYAVLDAAASSHPLKGCSFLDMSVDSELNNLRLTNTTFKETIQRLTKTAETVHGTMECLYPGTLEIIETAPDGISQWLMSQDIKVFMQQHGAHIRSLAIHGATFETFADLFAFLGLFPSVQKLDLKQVACGNAGRVEIELEIEERYTVGPQPGRRVPTGPQLQLITTFKCADESEITHWLSHNSCGQLDNLKGIE